LLETILLIIFEGFPFDREVFDIILSSKLSDTWNWQLVRPDYIPENCIECINSIEQMFTLKCKFNHHTYTIDKRHPCVYFNDMEDRIMFRIRAESHRNALVRGILPAAALTIL
jgi:hypothetical protein